MRKSNCKYFIFNTNNNTFTISIMHYMFPYFIFNIFIYCIVRFSWFNLFFIINI